MKNNLLVNLSMPLVSIYASRQFIKYVLCGGISSLVHITARLILSQYVNFSWAVFLSYFVGMPVALLLYRVFVFHGREGKLSRQFLLFSITYFGFLPVTWVLSVVSEALLVRLMPTGQAQLLAHLVGVAGPVVLNFAYNKFITFGERLPAHVVSERE
jgi:putative flippase GtrA